MQKINISLVFITQSYFSVPKDVRLNSTHCLIMKINNKRKLQNMQLIILQILIIKILQKFTENAKKNIYFFDNRYYITSQRSFKILKKLI